MHLNVSTVFTCDLSPFLRFHFWEPVFFNTEDTSFPNYISEERGHFVGIRESFGHGITFKNLNTSTNKIINRCDVRLVNDKASSNLRADTVNSTEAITSLREDQLEAKDADSETSSNKEDPESGTSTKERSSPSSSSKHVPAIDPNDLVESTFLLNKEGRQRLRARVVKSLDNFEGNLARDSSRLKFACSVKHECAHAWR